MRRNGNPALRPLSLVLICFLAASFAGIVCTAGRAQTAKPGANQPAQSASPVGLVSLAGGNKYFSYPGFELWDAANWNGTKAKATPIATWVTAHEKDTHPEYVVKDKYKGITNWVGNPDYNWKTESIDDTDVTAPLAKMGLRVDIREGGGLAIYVAPEKVLADKTHKVPMLIVPHIVDKMDVFWAMNTLVHFSKYNEQCAKQGDFIIVFVVMEKSAAGRNSPLNSTAIETASDVYRGDYKRLYLDMSVFAENGTKAADVPGVDWSGDDEVKRNPDAEIEHIGSIPALNVTGKWTAKPAGGGIGRGRATAYFDPQRIVRGKLGEHWMEGIRFLHDHGKDSDPAIKVHFDQMGLIYSEHHTQSERWLMFSPKQAVEENKKLPLVLILSEVYDFNEYAIGGTYASHLDYFKLAAEGDINVMVFALESPETMDLAYDIIKEAEKTAPIDPSRIYVTGHSHNGHLTREFAYRHPDMVAAAAPLGNSSGLAAPAYSHEAVVADDARIAAWSKIDMPIITIGAASEELSPHTLPSSILNDYDLFIEAWQRRLTASRVPMQSREQIMAAEHSDDYVTRLYGLPNDGSSLQVIDGVPHYIIDVKNIDGKKHLRFVAVENMIHTAEPTMPMVAWTFMRRFARDQQTGKVIELY